MGNEIGQNEAGQTSDRRLAALPKTEPFDTKWSALETATISDALDRCAIAGQALGIHVVVPCTRLVGRAFTVRFAPAGISGGTVGDYLDDVPRGAVIVLDNAGRRDATVWGGILTAIAQRIGVAGTVIDGVCRDVAQARDLQYPVFSRGCAMRTGKDRVTAVAIGEPISLGRACVEPGDLVVGDADGVVVVPRSKESEVLETALEIERLEAELLDLVGRGCRLDAARKQVGYHTLQRRAAHPS